MKRMSSHRAIAFADASSEAIATPAVGVVSMDDSHRAQVALVDAIERAAAQGNDEHVGGLLLRLFEETSDHFASEHELMRATAFPEREAHIEEHVRLLQQVSDLLACHSAGQMTRRSIESLRGWLLSHIQGMDRRLGDYLVAYTRDQTAGSFERDLAVDVRTPAIERLSDYVAG